MRYCDERASAEPQWTVAIKKRSLRNRKRVKRTSHACIVQDGPDVQWEMDFVSDSLIGGRRM